MRRIVVRGSSRELVEARPRARERRTELRADGRALRGLAIGLVGLALGCSEGEAPGKEPDERDSGSDADAGAGEDASTVDYFSCSYENPFSHEFECREYRGAAWDEQRAAADCMKPFTGVVGELKRTSCATPDAVGTCTADRTSGDLVVYWFWGGDPGVLQAACKNFLMGDWQAGPNAPEIEAPELAPEVLAALLSDERVSVTPNDCRDEACRESLIASGEPLVFAPAVGTPAFGLVFLPGGGIDTRAYAEAARRLAEHGVLVALALVEGNFALNSLEVVDRARSSRTDVPHWFVGGHSLGGAAALEYAKTATGLSGILLWAGGPDEADDLTHLAPPVLLLSGELDGHATPQEIAARLDNFPASLTHVALPGANHSQFANYGLLDHDNPATLEPRQQLFMASDISEHFMRRVLAGGATAHPGFAAMATALPGACERAQRDVLGLGADQLIAEEVLVDPMAFAVSKAAIDQGGLQVRARPIYAGNAAQLDAPPMLIPELWCKFKTSEALAAAGLAAGTQGSCGDLNALAFERALAQLQPDQRARWDALGLTVTFAADVALATGVDWLGAPGVQRQRTDTAWTYTSAQLQVSLTAQASEEFLGVQYCKLLSAEGALLDILGALAAAP